MRGLRFRLAWLVLVVPAAAAAQELATEPAPAAQPQATARPTEPPAAADPREQARAHFDRGNSLMEAENWEGAMLELQRSLELFPTRSALFNLGMCQKALFRYPEAMRTFERFLAEYSEQADEAQVQRVAEVIEELRQLLAELDITVNIAGALVYVDGEAVGAAPLVAPVQVVAGRHTIEARLSGYASAQRTIPITSGERLAVSLSMDEIARVGGVRIEANVPDAEVFVDGDRVGAVPYRGVLPEGSYEVRLSAPGYDSQVQTVTVAMGEERIATFSLAETSGAHPAWFWSMIGLTAAGAVATTTLGAFVIVGNDEYVASEDRSQEAYDEGKLLMVATDVCLGVTLAAAVAAAVLGFTTNWDDEEPTVAEPPDVSVTAAVGPSDSGASLMLVGRF